MERLTDALALPPMIGGQPDCPSAEFSVRFYARPGPLGYDEKSLCPDYRVLLGIRGKAIMVVWERCPGCVR